MRKGRFLLIPVIISLALILVRVVLVVASSPETSNITDNQPDASLQIAAKSAREWVTGDTDVGATVDVTVADQASILKEDAAVRAAGSGKIEIGLAATSNAVPGTTDLLLEINYGHDWVQGPYEPGHTVWITATESDGSTVKGWAELWSRSIPEWGDETGFSTIWDGWSGERPDLQSGDWVLAKVDNGYSGAVRIGAIAIEVDDGGDLVSGALHANWLSYPVELRCEIWESPGAPVIETTVDLDGGSYLCDFGAVGWDIQPNQLVAVMYADPAGHTVINTFTWPHLAAHIGPLSDGDRHVWGEGAAPGAMIPVTVTTELGDFVAGTAVQADPSGNFNTGDNLPEGSLAPWYNVEVDFGNGITKTLTIYPLQGLADPDTDVVTVTAAGDSTFTINLEYCKLDQCNWIELGEIGFSGVVEVDLMAEREFDVLPGDSFHAHLYAWDRQEVIYSWGLGEPDGYRRYLPLIIKK